jgi:hypothetical protein
MLDADHPQTEPTFAASRIEDVIRSHLIAMRTLDANEKSVRASEILTVQIPALYALNIKHFGASPGIAHTIRQLEIAVRSGDVEECWQRFISLAERPGDNFGTWAI